MIQSNNWKIIYRRERERRGKKQPKRNDFEMRNPFCSASLTVDNKKKGENGNNVAIVIADCSRLKEFNRAIKKKNFTPFFFSIPPMDAKTSLIQPTFLFGDRQRFDAQHEHDQLRSSIRSHTDIPLTADPWKQRPVDFTMKNFHPNRKKNRTRSSSNDAISSQEKSTGNSRQDDPSVMRPFAVGYQHTTHTSLADDDQDKPFQVDPRIDYDKVHRMLNTEQYRNPQPHDFRQVFSSL